MNIEKQTRTIHWCSNKERQIFIGYHSYACSMCRGSTDAFDINIDVPEDLWRNIELAQHNNYLKIKEFKEKLEQIDILIESLNNLNQGDKNETVNTHSEKVKTYLETKKKV